MQNLFRDFEKTCDSVRKEGLCNILTDFGSPVKLVRLIKMCLIETCRRDSVGKHLSDMFPVKNGLKQGAALLPLLLSFALECAIRRVQANQNGF